MYDKKEHFYKKVATDHAESELTSILLSHPDCGFYEVCQKLVDVGLNATKVKGEVGKIEAIFHDRDIDAAREVVKAFIAQYQIKGIDEFLSILKSCYPYATDPFETRKTSSTIMAKEHTHGTFFNFSEMPDEIFELIIKDIEQ